MSKNNLKRVWSISLPHIHKTNTAGLKQKRTATRNTHKTAYKQQWAKTENKIPNSIRIHANKSITWKKRN